MLRAGGSLCRLHRRSLRALCRNPSLTNLLSISATTRLAGTGCDGSSACTCPTTGSGGTSTGPKLQFYAPPPQPLQCLACSLEAVRLRERTIVCCHDVTELLLLLGSLQSRPDLVDGSFVGADAEQAKHGLQTKPRSLRPGPRRQKPETPADCNQLCHDGREQAQLRPSA